MKTKARRNIREANNARQNKKDQIEFLRDFDLLTTITQEQKVLYETADIHRAQTLVEENYPLNENNQKFPLSCDIEEFQKFGPGIYLLFKFLKFSTIIFGIISIIAIIIIAILASGETELTHSERNGFKNFILRSTIQNMQEFHFGAIVALNMVIVVVLSAGLIFWGEKQPTYIFECLKKIQLSSYYTVILKNLPDDYTQFNMKTYLQSQIGPIAEIYTVRDFGEDMLKFKDINDIVQEYKEEKALIDLDKDEQRKSTKLTRLFLEFRSGHHKIKQRIKQTQKYKSCFAFIQFRLAQDRDELIKKTNDLIKCISFPSKENQSQKMNQQHVHLYNKDSLNFIECQMEPNGIIWQNLHLSLSQKIIKTSLILFLAGILLALSVFLISLLSSIEMSIYNTVYRTMKKQEILSLNNDFALLSYCINLSIGQFQKESQICEKFQADYIKITYLVLLIPLSISLFKFLLTELMKLLVHFRRYEYEIKKIESQAFILFIFYFLVTGAIQLSIYISFGTNSSFFILFTPFIQLIMHQGFSADQLIMTNDYTPDWYILAAYNIILIGAISFNLSALGIIFYCYIRKKICYFMAKKQKIQIRMNQWLEGFHLQIQFIYASAFTIIFFTMLFAGSMPILYILAFISFLIQYWAYKYIFIQYCAKPLVFNHSISRKARKLKFVAIIVHCLVTPVFFKSPGISGLTEQLSFFERILSMGYYLAIIILLITYLLLRKPLEYLILKLRYSHKKKKIEKASQQFNSDNIPPPPELIRNKSSLPTEIRSFSNQQDHQSYSIHESKTLKKTLLTLYTINNRQRSRKTCLLNRKLFHLYEDSIKTAQNQSPEFRTLFEVINLVRRDFKKHKKQYGKKRNPYEMHKRKLYQIFLHCKGGKAQTFTLNKINYRFGEIDQACDKLQKQNFTEQDFRPYELSSNNYNSSVIDEALQQEQQSHPTTPNKNNNTKFLPNNIEMPPNSQNRLNDDEQNQDL